MPRTSYFVPPVITWKRHRVSPLWLGQCSPRSSVDHHYHRHLHHHPHNQYEHLQQQVQRDKDYPPRQPHWSANIRELPTSLLHHVPSPKVACAGSPSWKFVYDFLVWNWVQILISFVISYSGQRLAWEMASAVTFRKMTFVWKNLCRSAVAMLQKWSFY